MEKVLSIIKNKQETTVDGLGGAFIRYLLLKYKDSELNIFMPYSGLIGINDKYYNIQYEGDSYSAIYNIFGYNENN